MRFGVAIGCVRAFAVRSLAERLLRTVVGFPGGARNGFAPLVARYRTAFDLVVVQVDEMYSRSWYSVEAGVQIPTVMMLPAAVAAAAVDADDASWIDCCWWCCW